MGVHSLAPLFVIPFPLLFRPHPLLLPHAQTLESHAQVAAAMLQMLPPDSSSASASGSRGSASGGARSGGASAVGASGSGGAGAEPRFGSLDVDNKVAGLRGLMESMRSMGESRHCVCDGCGQKALGLRRCSRCRKVAYCSTECQKANWKAHKPECTPAAAT